jgi:hypothetical protein
MEKTDARAPEGLGASFGIRSRIQQVVHKEISPGKEFATASCGHRQGKSYDLVDSAEILVELWSRSPLLAREYE